jgi:hypothetical protein
MVRLGHEAFSRIFFAIGIFAASARPSAESAVVRDRAYDLVGGVWTCRTFAGNSLTHRYHRAEDAVSLVGDTDVNLGSRRATLGEAYTYRHARVMWVVSLAHGNFTAQADPFFAEEWTFVGRDVEIGHDWHVRIFLATSRRGGLRERSSDWRITLGKVTLERTHSQRRVKEYFSRALAALRFI